MLVITDWQLVGLLFIVIGWLIDVLSMACCVFAVGRWFVAVCVRLAVRYWRLVVVSVACCSSECVVCYSFFVPFIAYVSIGCVWRASDGKI